MEAALQPETTHTIQIPEAKKSIRSKLPSMLRTVIHQDLGKFWNQALSESMERESVVAASYPVKER